MFTPKEVVFFHFLCYLRKTLAISNGVKDFLPKREEKIVAIVTKSILATHQKVSRGVIVDNFGSAKY